jgi:hypothetical protein
VTGTSTGQQYRGFGVTLASSVPLSVPTQCPDAARTDPDIRIGRTPLPLDSEHLDRKATLVHEDAELGITVRRTPDALYWFYDGIGTLRVRDGRTIGVAPAPAARDAVVERFVLGPGIQSALIQRGYLVLHASAVVVGGALVAIAGPSGRGKSTVAAACYASGHAVHADDAVVVDVDGGAGATVPPGIPRVRIGGSVVDALSLRANVSAREGEKVALDVSDRFSGTTRELDRVYLLTDDERVGIETLSSPESVFRLLRASHALYSEGDGARAEEHLTACGALARAVDVCRLGRPRSLDRLGGLVRRLEADAH